MKADSLLSEPLGKPILIGTQNESLEAMRGERATDLEPKRETDRFGAQVSKYFHISAELGLSKQVLPEPGLTSIGS